MKSMIAPFAAMVAVATALFLSSCTSSAPTAGDGHTDHAQGSESSAPAPDGQAPHNAADVTFATDMIPHHEQAVAMSELAPQRSTDPAVLKLAADIAAAQGPEIQTMTAFLAQWNASPATGHEGMPGMQMQGMVDDATMTRLTTLEGAEFDQLWLQSMIGHHEGAIAMAKTEIADGTNADAKALAQQIVSAQQAEITQMKEMLAT
jgi:uncharacterized protein (DUF305 family)